MENYEDYDEACGYLYSLGYNADQNRSTSDYQPNFDNYVIEDITNLTNDNGSSNNSTDKVFVNVLKVMKRHHIERLLKKFHMGTQILFEHNLEEWRLLSGFPLDDKPLTIITGSRNLESIQNSSSPNTRASSPKSVSDYSEIPSLNRILSKSPKSSAIFEYYSKIGKFQEEQRILENECVYSGILSYKSKRKNM
ncbi:hypothetical protein FQA39_LY05043 [Lamprigera yunnana]|nr:hypothetical protein FQA39_LY05043 [Lamprigera yunnana]